MKGLAARWKCGRRGRRGGGTAAVGGMREAAVGPAKLRIVQALRTGKAGYRYPLKRLMVFSAPMVQKESTMSFVFFISGGSASNSSCVKLLST